MPVETSKCPWCGNTIPQVKFVEIEGRIRAEEKQKLAEQAKKLALAEANLKREYEERSKLQIQAEVKKLADKERKAAELRIKEETAKLRIGTRWRFTEAEGGASERSDFKEADD